MRRPGSGATITRDVEHLYSALQCRMGHPYGARPMGVHCTDALSKDVERFGWSYLGTEDGSQSPRGWFRIRGLDRSAVGVDENPPRKNSIQGSFERVWFRRSCSSPWFHEGKGQKERKKKRKKEGRKESGLLLPYTQASTPGTRRCAWSVKRVL